MHSNEKEKIKFYITIQIVLLGIFLGTFFIIKIKENYREESLSNKEWVKIGLAYIKEENQKIDKILEKYLPTFKKLLRGKSIRIIGKIENKKDIFKKAKKNRCLNILVIELIKFSIDEKLGVILTLDLYNTLEKVLIYSNMAEIIIPSKEEVVLKSLPNLISEIKRKFRENNKKNKSKLVKGYGIGITQEEALREAQKYILKNEANLIISSKTICRDFQIIKDEIITRYEGKLKIKKTRFYKTPGNLWKAVIWAEPLRKEMIDSIANHPDFQDILRNYEFIIIYPKDSNSSLQSRILEDIIIFLKRNMLKEGLQLRDQSMVVKQYERLKKILSNSNLLYEDLEEIYKEFPTHFFIQIEPYITINNEFKIKIYFKSRYGRELGAYTTKAQLKEFYEEQGLTPPSKAISIQEFVKKEIFPKLKEDIIREFLKFAEGELYKVQFIGFTSKEYDIIEEIIENIPGIINVNKKIITRRNLIDLEISFNRSNFDLKQFLTKQLNIKHIYGEWDIINNWMRYTKIEKIMEFPITYWIQTLVLLIIILLISLTFSFFKIKKLKD